MPPTNLFIFFAEVAVLCVIYLATAYVVALDSDERQFIHKIISRQAGANATQAPPA